jgi:hypothetical protein
MNRPTPTTILVITSFALAARTASAHSSSGIVVDQQGQVFFQDILGRAIWKIDAQGKLTKYHDKLGGHWMALDAQGSFSRAKIPHFERITPDGEKPALVVADGGSPIAVSRDGHLYYLCGFSRTRPTDPGKSRCQQIIFFGTVA